MKVYNKLVRDKIPEIIKESNRKCKISIASKEEKIELLEKKLMEEVNEYLQDKNLMELGDIMEVIFSLARELGYEEQALINMREQKRAERGGFKKGIVLHYVE